MFSKFLVVFFNLLMFPAALYAQEAENTIQVIQEDGAIQSLEIPKNTVANKPRATSSMSTEDLLKKMGEAIGDDEAQVKEDSSADAAQEPAPKTEIVKQPEAKKKTTAVSKKEVKQAVTKKAQKKKVVKQSKVTKKRVAPTKQTYVPSEVVPIPPPVKPEKQEIIQISKPTVIDKDAALRIALEYAPPARSFTVYENRKYQDHVVFQVTFRTENGLHDILVDSKTGKILKK